MQAASFPPPYEARRPTESILYQTLVGHLATFADERERELCPLPKYVREESKHRAKSLGIAWRLRQASNVASLTPLKASSSSAMRVHSPSVNFWLLMDWGPSDKLA